jgi:hypothetical protein
MNDDPHLYEFYYIHDDSGITLRCLLEYDEGIPENNIEPNFTLVYAYVDNVDVFGLLHHKLVDDIERRALRDPY